MAGNETKTTIDAYALKRNQVFNGTTPYLTTYDWEIHFLKAPDVYTGTDAGLVENVLNNTFKLRTTQWSAPDIPDAQPITVNIKGHVFTQPGMALNYGAVTMNLMDNSDLVVTKYVTTLEKAMDDPLTHSTNHRNPAAMAFNFNIYQLDPRGNKKMMWACRHAVLTSATTDAVTGTSDKQVVGRVTLRFQVDWFEILFDGDTRWSDFEKGTDEVAKSS